MKEIKIKPANNGWIIEIGCGTFVAEDKTHMLREIGRYIDDPAEVEKEYGAKKVNNADFSATANLTGTHWTDSRTTSPTYTTEPI